MKSPPSKQNVAILLTDAERRILWVNEHYTSMTGYTISEVLGRKPSLLQGTDSQSEVVEQMRRCMEDGVAFKNQVVNYRKNGEEYDCRLVVHPVYNDRDELTNYIAFEMDVSQVSDGGDLELLTVATKYQTSSLKGAASLDLYKRLRKSMDQDNLYLDPSLKLPYLAEVLDTNTKYLSQVVNHHYGDNLQQFVNEYRVKTAKEELLNKANGNLTYFGIGQRCGFKNKSTFYKVFKKFTGKTPHEYVVDQQEMAH